MLTEELRALLFKSASEFALNRLSRSSTISAVPAASHSYTANDWLGSDSYDNNGNTVGPCVDLTLRQSADNKLGIIKVISWADLQSPNYW